MMTEQEKEAIKKRMLKLGYDTAVRCPKCGKVQYLMFSNGIKNGWSKCCGYTMTIVITTANIEEVVSSSINSQIGGLIKWSKHSTNGL